MSTEDKQPDALRLAVAIQKWSDYHPHINEAAAELLRLHALSEDLMSALKESRRQVLNGIRIINAAIAKVDLERAHKEGQS